MTGTARLLGIVAVIAAAMLWGTTGTLQSVLPDAREPLVVGAIRLFVGAFALLAIAAITPSALRAFRQLPWAIVCFAGFAISAYNLLFFSAVSYAGVGVGTAIAIGSGPIWVTLYEVLTQRRWPKGLRAIGQALSIIGAAMLVLQSGSESASLWGILLAGFAGLAYASYSLATSRMSAAAPSATIASATFLIAALLAVPVFFMFPLAWALSGAAWPVLLSLGILSTGVSYALYTWGLTRVAASTAVTLALIEPLTAWVLAIWIVGEIVTLQKLIGAALLFLGLLLVTLQSSKPATQTPS